MIDSNEDHRTNKERLNVTESSDAMHQSIVLEDLRAHIARIEGASLRHAAIPFGLEVINSRLPGGGIATARSTK